VKAKELPMRAPNGDMIPATNRKGVVDGSTTHKFRDGKIARTKTFWDMTSLLMQLGLMPQ
jgi:ketosteroid isomerase-like protein